MTTGLKNAATVSITRRRFLLGSAAGVIVLGAAGLWTASFGRRDYGSQWIEHTIRRNLPGVVLDESSLRQFAQEMLAAGVLQSRKREVSVIAQQTLPWMSSRIPPVREGLMKLERYVLTEYLMGSDFFRVPDPKTASVITYYGRALTCANPFSRAA